MRLTTRAAEALRVSETDSGILQRVERGRAQALAPIRDHHMTEGEKLCELQSLDWGP